MSDEIIKVIDELGKRFGIVIDWSSENVLPYILNEVKLKTSNQKELASVDIQKIEFLMNYVSAFRQQEVGYKEYIQYLYDKNKEIFVNTYDSVSQHFFYNEDKYIKLDYETIGKIKPILNEFESYAEYEMNKRLKQSIKDVTYNYVKDDTYFNEIKQYYHHITISK